MLFQSPPQRSITFSVFDIIALFAILAILLGLVPIVLYLAHQSAQQAVSRDNLKKMILGLHSADDAHKKLAPAIGWFPMAERRNSGWSRPAGYGTVFYHILPFIESNNIYINTVGISSNSFGTVFPIYTSPTDPTAPKTGLHHHNRGAISYGVNGYAFIDERHIRVHGHDVLGCIARVRPGQQQSHTSLSKIKAQDGASNTVAFAERFAACWTPVAGQKNKWRKFERVWGEATQFFNNYSPVIRRGLQSENGDGTRRNPWTVPPQLLPQFGADMKNCEPGTWQAFDGNVIHVGLFDGSVRNVQPRITLMTWSNALRPDDGFVLGPDW